jgi:hypothetical protein
MSSEYLVQYGRSAFVGRFTTDALAVVRGDRVVVRTPRGVELGTILCPAHQRYAGQIDPAAGGDVIRLASEVDAASADRLEHVGRDLVADAERRASATGLPLAFLDAEPMLDGPVLLHAVAWDACDADPLFAELSAAFGRPVRLHDVARTPVAKDPPEKASVHGSVERRALGFHLLS